MAKLLPRRKVPDTSLKLAIRDTISVVILITGTVSDISPLLAPGLSEARIPIVFNHTSPKVIALAFCAGVLTALLIAALISPHTDCRRRNRHRSINDSHILSHEIRTPLSLIKGAAEILSDETAGALTGEQRHFINTITANSERVIAMAEDFLTDAKLSSPQFALNYSRFDLRQLIRETARELREVNDMNLYLTDAGDPLFIDADRDLIRHVAWNLITNASRHAGPDSTITVRSYATKDGAGLEVRDDGRGMTPDDRQELFTPFAHVSTQSHKPTDGTGIGLGIVERIVHLHRGRIIVDTLTDRGTSIHILLPWHRRGRPQRWRTIRKLMSTDSRSDQ